MTIMPEDYDSAWFVEPHGLDTPERAWRIIADSTWRRWQQYHTSARVDYLALVFDADLARRLVYDHNTRHAQQLARTEGSRL